MVIAMSTTEEVYRMKPTAKPYRHIETLLTHHYRGLAERRKATRDDLAAVSRQLEELEELIESNALYPKGQTARYEPFAGQGSGTPSDPTAQAAGAYDAADRRYRARIASLRSCEAGYQGEIYELEVLERHTTAATRMLKAEDRDIILARHQNDRRLNDIALEMNCDEKTVRHHLNNCYRAIDFFLRPRLTPQTLPFLWVCLPEIFPANTRQTSCFSTDLVLQ